MIVNADEHVEECKSIVDPYSMCDPYACFRRHIKGFRYVRCTTQWRIQDIPL